MAENISPDSAKKPVDHHIIQHPHWERNLADPAQRAKHPDGAFVAVARSVETRAKIVHIEPLPIKEGDDREIDFHLRDSARVQACRDACAKALAAAVKAAGGRIVAESR